MHQIGRASDAVSTHQSPIAGDPKAPAAARIEGAQAVARGHDRRQRFGGRAASLGLALALLLGAGAVFFAWNVSERHGRLERELVLRQQDSAALAREARLFAKQAQEGMLEGAAKLALVEVRLAEVTLQRGQLEELLQSLTRSRDENLIVDIDAAIRVALQQNAITGSAEPLLAALKQADDRLQRHAQTKFERVRRAIARDLDRVRAAGVVDVSTLAIKLDEAIRLVDELPLLASLESRRASPRAPAPAKPASAGASGLGVPATSVAAGASTPGGGERARSFGQSWDAAWERTMFEARSLIRVTRIDHPEAMLIAPEQAFFLKENLKLRLLNARLALLSRQFETAQSDLADARSSLDRFFDRASKRTTLARELVNQVAAQSHQLLVPRPDDTLAALAAAGAGR